MQEKLEKTSIRGNMVFKKKCPPYENKKHKYLVHTNIVKKYLHVRNNGGTF